MKNLIAKDIMNPSVISVEEDLSVHELANFFTEKMISGAPVVNKDGNNRCSSLSDIIRNDRRRTAIVNDKIESDYYLNGWEDNLNSDEIQELHLEEDDSLTVRNIMPPLIFKVKETELISAMSDIMIGGRIHRLLVTRDEKVVGIITTLDMLKAIREHAN